MANVLSSNLYPPLIDTFMPASLSKGPVTASFSVSAYNSASAITRLHISLVNQKTNLSVFMSNQSWSERTDSLIDGIWIIPFTESDFLKQDTSKGIWTLSIPGELLKNKNKTFSTDGYYKLQLRFDKTSTSIAIKSGYLTNNRSQFSEWSSVCLLKTIPEPSIELNNFQEVYNPGVIPISGRVIFNNNLTGTKEETLRSYTISIFNKDDPTDVLDSIGPVFTGDNVDPNTIYWLADGENAKVGTTYNVKIDIITKNQFEKTENFSFDIYDYSSIDFTPTFTFVKNQFEKYNVIDDGKVITKEDGIVKFNIKVKEQLPPGYLYVKRGSSLDNYKKWDLISCTKENGTVNRDFFDMTVGSLVRYKYSVQYQLKKGSWTNSIQSNEIIYPDFYDMLISRKDRQLAIRYDGQITNLTPVVNRKKIDTLGGKYPKFAENAQMNYKSYTITGLIDAESDFNRKFLDDRNYKNQMNDYNNQMDGKYQVRNDTIADGDLAYLNYENTQIQTTQKNTVHDLYPVNNWWLEREFREQAIEWLNDGEPKLFRSMTEGNLAVMITDITLTPEPMVGRRLYRFNANMYEIENGYSLETLNSLGIVDIVNEKEIESDSSTPSGGGSEGDDDDEDINLSVTQVGQFYSQLFDHGSAGYASAILNSMQGDNSEDRAYNYQYLSVEDKLNWITYEQNSVDGQLYKVVDDKVTLKNVKIQFESKPKWYRFSGNDIILVGDSSSTSNKNTYDKDLHLGYKIQLTTSSDSKRQPLIFVNEKGYYQTPSNLEVTNLFFYDNPIATVDYIMNYKTTYNESKIPSGVTSAGDIIGQVYGIWRPSTYVANLISDKHYYIELDNDGKMQSEEKIRSWYATSLEVTPYSIVAIRFDGTDTRDENFVVGRTGIFNLFNDYPMKELQFLGRRMVRAEDDRQPYLDEWEYVLDDSAKKIKGASLQNLTWEKFVKKQIEETNILVDINSHTTTAEKEGINRLWNNLDNTKILSWKDGYTSVSDIKNPQYNTVYAIREKDTEGNLTFRYMIYYIDEAWYDISFQNDSREVAIAAVPVYGAVNYKANLIKQSF